MRASSQSRTGQIFDARLDITLKCPEEQVGRLKDDKQGLAGVAEQIEKGCEIGKYGLRYMYISR